MSTTRANWRFYTAELNQILQTDRGALVVGGRYQTGQFDTWSQLENPPAGLAPLFSMPAANTNVCSDFERITGYGYLTLKPFPASCETLENLWLTAGLAYDRITWPRNFRYPPVSAGEVTDDQFGTPRLPWCGVLCPASPSAALTPDPLRCEPGRKLPA